jgi:hypothetical protein
VEPDRAVGGRPADDLGSPQTLGAGPGGRRGRDAPEGGPRPRPGDEIGRRPDVHACLRTAAGEGVRREHDERAVGCLHDGRVVRVAGPRRSAGLRGRDRAGQGSAGQQSAGQGCAVGLGAHAPSPWTR